MGKIGVHTERNNVLENFPASAVEVKRQQHVDPVRHEGIDCTLSRFLTVSLKFFQSLTSAVAGRNHIVDVMSKSMHPHHDCRRTKQDQEAAPAFGFGGDRYRR